MARVITGLQREQIAPDCVREMVPPLLHEHHHEAGTPTSKRSAIAG